MIEVERSTARGAVAHAIKNHDIPALVRLAELMRARRVPVLALAGPIFGRLRGDGDGRAVALEASKYLGKLGAALAVILTGDNRRASDHEAYHGAIRALPIPALDALEDLLLEANPTFADLAAAERAFRQGMVADWHLETCDESEGVKVVIELVSQSRPELLN